MINGIIQGKRAYLYSDTAWVDPSDGVVVAIAPKLFIGSHFPWVLAVSIANGQHVDVAHAIAATDAKNVAGLIKALPQAVKVFEERSLAAEIKGQGIRLAAACWDARKQKPRLFVVSNMADGLEAHGAPGTVIEFYSYFSTAMSPFDLLGRTFDATDPAQFDADRDGLAIMEAARRIPMTSATGGPSYLGIGGGVDQVVITRRGVKSFSLGEWPDEVGRRIRGEGLDG